jgi:hypothetical protein
MVDFDDNLEVSVKLLSRNNIGKRFSDEFIQLFNSVLFI